jgi:antirestriction protein ArdC
MMCARSQNTVARGCNSEGGVMKRDLYAEVSKRIVAELERGAAPWIKPWSATAGMNPVLSENHIRAYL